MPTHPHVGPDDDCHEHDCAPVHSSIGISKKTHVTIANKSLCRAIQSHIYYMEQKRGPNIRLEICAIRATNDEKSEVQPLR